MSDEEKRDPRAVVRDWPLARNRTLSKIRVQMVCDECGYRKKVPPASVERTGTMPCPKCKNPSMTMGEET